MTEQNSGAPVDASSASPAYKKRGRSKTAIIATIAVVASAAVIAAIVFAVNANKPSAADVAGSELTVGLTLAPTNLDIRNTGGVALDQILVDNVYQGLVGLASGSLTEFVPVLAESLPAVSDDSLTYTFTLRDNVTFHSGAVLTAADVVDSLSASLVIEATGTAATITATDERTVQIELETPNSQLLWHLANRPGLVFESAYTGDLANTTNGTGPYTLSDWKEGDSITFTAEKSYWGETPTVETVVWRYITDGNAAVNAVLDGDLDVLAPVTSSLAAQFDDNAAYEVIRAASTDVYTLGFNTQKAPLNDARVRQAISMAISGESIVESFYGDGKPLGGPITELEPAYVDLTDVYPYDPEEAKELLEAAGVRDIELTVTMPNFYPTDSINQVATQLEEIGVTLNIESVEFAAWLSDVYAAPEDGSVRTFDLSYIDHAEANDFGNYANPGYYFGYDNTEVQKLYAASIAATDAAEATELIQQAERIVATDVPAKWLINWTPANVVGTHVEGFPESNTNSRINLTGVSVTK